MAKINFNFSSLLDVLAVLLVALVISASINGREGPVDDNPPVVTPPKDDEQVGHENQKKC
ncbi:MAG: hypothetical protein ACLU5J_01480 [Christensenellales bacterium]